jgi:hypothetical protein
MRHSYVLVAQAVAVEVSKENTMSGRAGLMNDEVRLDYGTNTELRFWRTIASVPRRSDCEARLREEIGHVTHSDDAPKNVRFKLGDAVQVTYFRSDKLDEKLPRVQTFRYVCLADTVDPRGPKGK